MFASYFTCTLLYGPTGDCRRTSLRMTQRKNRSSSFPLSLSCCVAVNLRPFRYSHLPWCAGVSMAPSTVAGTLPFTAAPRTRFVTHFSAPPQGSVQHLEPNNDP